MVFNYISAIIECVLISAFALLVGIPRYCMFWSRIKICVEISVVKQCTSTVLKKEKKHQKLALLAETKLNTL